MKKHQPHTITNEALSQLKEKLHRIPEQHLVDRTTSPVVAKKPSIIQWSLAAMSMAASLALIISLWPAKEVQTEFDVSDEMFEELYSLGYVELEDMYAYVEPDSIGFSAVDIDPDVYYDYYEDPDYYLSEL